MAKDQFYELSSNAFEKRGNCPYCRDCSSDVIGPVYIPAFWKYPVGKIKINNQLSNDIYLLKCQNCGLLYKSLIVTREALAQVYKGSEACCNYKSDNRSILQKLHVMRKRVNAQNAHVLDIGCHTGQFLKIAKKMGFKTSGLEYSDVASSGYEDFINMAYYKGFLEDAQLPADTFDIITAWDIFEHLYDVGAGLRKIHHSLKLGGYLFLETGNASCLPARLRSPNNWWYVSGLGHFNFFDAVSIRHIFNNMNFKVIFIDKVYHKYIYEIGPIQISRALLKSLVFYVSPLKVYRYLSRVKEPSEKAARLPWKDHIFIVAQKQ